ncbi:PstS family phosphate ABC transporter substrate-binding protein [uncultured Selenomonas sp.]|uniref:PstS family phosphate ABC transporter substrate-binding protein n=1 Tax=uncultured Selenomonas sp. TaxID=159275 RepID=UPI0025FD4F99|nr:substrate-binding domain-containing protein [uncultured Selenomonas sp.]
MFNKKKLVLALVDHKVVVEPFVFIVDKANKVDNLTKDQVVGILTGKIQNWKDVGGDDQKITLIGEAHHAPGR